MIEKLSARSSAIGYLPALDGLRGIAVLIVVLFHFQIPGFSGGGLGVDVFFVLSGYLITAILLKEWGKTGTIHFPHFYLRRILRLAPAYYFCVGLTLLLIHQMTIGLGMPRWEALAYCLTYTTNWARAFHVEGYPVTFLLGPLGHTWSLAIEEQFYLLWPPVLYLCLKRGVSRRSLVISLLLCIIAVELWRPVLWHSWHGFAGTDGTWRVYNGLDTRADTLLLGCLIALLPPETVRRRLSSQTLTGAGVLGICLLFSVLLTMHDGGILYVAGLTVIAWASTLLVAALTQGDRFPALTRLLSWRPLVYLGSISYGIYLYHQLLWWLDSRFHPGLPLIRLISWHLPGWHQQPTDAMNWWSDRMATVLLTILVAALSYRFVEQPLLSLKSRFK